MNSYSSTLEYSDSCILLDDEFDKVGDNPDAVVTLDVAKPSAGIEIAWDDQLDNGQEMSL